MHETRLKWPRPVNFAFTVLDAGLFAKAQLTLRYRRATEVRI